MVQVFNSSTQEAEAGKSLNSRRASSRTARATERSPVSKTTIAFFFAHYLGPLREQTLENVKLVPWDLANRAKLPSNLEQQNHLSYKPKVKKGGGNTSEPQIFIYQP